MASAGISLVCYLSVSDPFSLWFGLGAQRGCAGDGWATAAAVWGQRGATGRLRRGGEEEVEEKTHRWTKFLTSAAKTLKPLKKSRTTCTSVFLIHCWIDVSLDSWSLVPLSSTSCLSVIFYLQPSGHPFSCVILVQKRSHWECSNAKYSIFNTEEQRSELEPVLKQCVFLWETTPHSIILAHFSIKISYLFQFTGRCILCIHFMLNYLTKVSYYDQRQEKISDHSLKRK